MQLVSTNLAGNLHNASDTINKMGLAEFVVHMDSSGHTAIVVFRVTDAHAPRLREQLGYAEEYLANPAPQKDRKLDKSYGVFAVPGGWAYRHFGHEAPVVGPFKDKAEAMKGLLTEVGFDVEN